MCSVGGVLEFGLLTFYVFLWNMLACVTTYEYVRYLVFLGQSLGCLLDHQILRLRTEDKEFDTQEESVQSLVRI